MSDYPKVHSIIYMQGFYYGIQDTSQRQFLKATTPTFSNATPCTEIEYQEAQHNYKQITGEQKPL